MRKLTASHKSIVSYPSCNCKYIYKFNFSH